MTAQSVPDDVTAAYDRLCHAGYTSRLVLGRDVPEGRRAAVVPGSPSSPP
ncbi:hypothetical protein ACFVTT_40015 [Streptomyces niveus]